MDQLNNTRAELEIECQRKGRTDSFYLTYRSFLEQSRWVTVVGRYTLHARRSFRRQSRSGRRVSASLAH